MSYDVDQSRRLNRSDARYRSMISRMPCCRAGTKRLRRPEFNVLSRHVLLLSAILAGLLFMPDASRGQYMKPGDLAPFEVVYEVGNHLINAGTAQLSLTQEGDLWYYSLITEPRGIIKLAGKGNVNESSVISITESDGELQMQPQTYRYRQDEESRRAVDATFDWSNNSIVHVHRGKVVTETFDTPVVDRLSATLQVMNALRHGYESIELHVFDTDGIRTIAFVNEGMEELETPLGRIETVRVINNTGTSSNRETITWFAPSLDYIPIRIEQRKDGELVARLNLLRLNNRAGDIELEPEEEN